MDPGVALRHSRHLAGLPPSTSPPPLGESTRQSERTNTHFDSHTDITMSHTSEILKQPSYPPPVWEISPSSTYRNPLGSDHPVAGTPHDYLSQFLEYIGVDHRYWSHIPSGETHHAPTSTSTIRYGLPDLPETGPKPNVGSGVDLGVALGGTSIPF